MRFYFAYVRVSTIKQGEHGSSLQEQRSAIEQYARKHAIEIVRWYEETETAAKLGRRVFTRMMGDRRREGVPGIVFHKIDRSARHLKDWAAIGDLIDEGVDVHFAHESLDLRSRGGRLAADIQAVVAADYVRNLREETRKGFYGRLKQGLYPMRAPIGYLDCGKGKPKTIDPVRGPLIRAAFELYAAGVHGLDTLRQELDNRGLRNRRGGRIARNGISTILHNPFYVGIIRINRTSEVFEGVHEPLVSRDIFNEVQTRLQGKTNHRSRSHEFLFRRLLRCASCTRTLIGELQKGRVYYRCHSADCRGVSIREDVFDEAVRAVLSHVRFQDSDLHDLRDIAASDLTEFTTAASNQLRELHLQLSALDARLTALTDALLEALIDKETYQSRRLALLSEKAEVKHAITALTHGDAARDAGMKFIELAQSALLSYESAVTTEKRELLRTVTSNLLLDGKKPVISLRSPFQEIATTIMDINGDPYRATYRTLLRKLWVFLTEVASSEKMAPIPIVAGQPIDPAQRP